MDLTVRSFDLFTTLFFIDNTIYLWLFPFLLFVVDHLPFTVCNCLFFSYMPQHMSDTHHVQVQGSAVSIQSSDKIEGKFLNIDRSIWSGFKIIFRFPTFLIIIFMQVSFVSYRIYTLFTFWSLISLRIIVSNARGQHYLVIMVMFMLFGIWSVDAFKKMKVDEKKVLRSNAYPVRPGERDCQYYLRTGLCGYGSSCRYNHPTPLPQVRIIVF